MGSSVASFMKDNLKIILVLLLVAFGVFAFMTVKSKATSTIDHASQTMDTLNETEFTDYDGALVKGSEVISCINNWKNYDVSIVVDGVCFNKHADAGYNTLTECTDATHRIGVCSRRDGGGATYISGSADYEGTVHYSTDGTNEVTCVEFTLH